MLTFKHVGSSLAALLLTLVVSPADAETKSFGGGAAPGANGGLSSSLTGGAGRPSTPSPAISVPRPQLTPPPSVVNSPRPGLPAPGSLGAGGRPANDPKVVNSPRPGLPSPGSLAASGQASARGSASRDKSR